MLPLTGGERQADIPAENYRDLLKALEARWPGLGEQLEDSAVAIDGHLYQDAWLEPIGTDSEVHFLPRIEGG